MNFGKLSRNDGIVEERQLISSQFSKSTPLFSIGGDWSSSVRFENHENLPPPPQKNPPPQVMNNDRSTDFWKSSMQKVIQVSLPTGDVVISLDCPNR